MSLHSVAAYALSAKYTVAELGDLRRGSVRREQLLELIAALSVPLCKYLRQNIHNSLLRIIEEHLIPVAEDSLLAAKHPVYHRILEYIVILHLIYDEVLDIVVGMTSVEIHLQVKYRKDILIAYLSIFISVLRYTRIFLLHLRQESNIQLNQIPLCK